MLTQENVRTCPWLSSAQVEHYRVEGYVVLDSFFDKAALDTVDDAVQALVDRALSGEDMSKVLELEPEPVDGCYVPRRIYKPYEQHEVFRQVAGDPRLLDCIEVLIGPKFNLHHSKLNMKPARVGSVVEWHQDLAYFPQTNDDLVTTLIYLDDATEENGCLQVLPRQHHRFFDHGDREGLFVGRIGENFAGGQFGRPVPLSAPAGSAILMHCLTPHTSLPNRSDHPRRTLIFEYRAADALPIYFGEMTSATAQETRPMRGEPARRARFAGPPPLIPRGGNWASLYDLQSRTREPERSDKET